MKKRILLWLFLVISLAGNAQMSVADSLEQVLQHTTEDSTRLRLLYEIVHEIYRSDFPKTIQYSTEALALAQKLGDTKQEMRANYFMAVGYYLSSNESQAIAYAEKSLELTKQRNDSESRMDCHNLLGKIYQNLNDVNTALEHLFESARLAEEYDNQDRLATTYSSIGEIYMENNELDKAKSYYRNALNILLDKKDFFFAAFLYNNLSEITESPDSSILLLNKAMDIFEQENYLDGIAHASNNLAAEYGKLKNFEKAYPFAERAREIFEDEEHYYKPGLISVYMNLGSILGAFGKMNEAEQWFEKSINMAKETGNKVLLKDAYEEFSDLMETQNKPQQALQYFKLAAAVKDSIFDESKAKELAESETRFQTQLKEKEIARKELELEIQSRQKNRILLGSIILLLLLSSIFLFFRYRQRLRRQKAEHDLKFEKAEASKLRELDKLKSNFFANISHEFRTPLTLILGPLRQMREGNFQGNVQKYQDIMIRNGERLMKLVNQLLDLSKLESGKMELNLEKGDLVKTVVAMAYSFESLAERQEINLEVKVPYEYILANFDSDKLEKILVNLLSNAFKYTPEKGTVSIGLKIGREEELPTEDLAIITVKDTGIGIPSAQLPQIFERFFQTSNTSDLQASSGIGLALTKELVDLHKGKIWVESELGKGTIFTFQIPIGKTSQEGAASQTEKKWIINEVTGDRIEAISSQETVVTANSAPLLLLVEDNKDVRTYVRDQLKTDYQIMEAVNGVEGLEKAKASIPDLIISDVMMPDMDGIEMCHSLKTDDKTSHIPIIMLTAKAEREDKIKGLQTGADDYLMKPFDATELKVRIQNLIEIRRRLQKSFGQDFNFHPKNVEVNSYDEAFLTNVKQSIEDNLDDENFSVVELSNAVAMSRSQLHRKLKALTNQSPNEIIRGMRLLRAKELLEKKAGNATEIAFMVGFNSATYFSKCFRDQFGISPSEVKEN